MLQPEHRRADAGNVRFPNDFEGFRETIMNGFFLAEGLYGKVEETHEFPLFFTGLAVGMGAFFLAICDKACFKSQ